MGELRRRNGQAEARIAELQRDNAELRMRLGLAPEEDGAPKCLPWREGAGSEHGQQDGGGGRQDADNGVIIEEAEDALEDAGECAAEGGVEKEAPVEID